MQTIKQKLERYYKGTSTATCTSAEKLDKAVKEGKWLDDAHINAGMKMIQS